MEFIKNLITWAVENKENLATVLICFGAFLEAVNALFPTPDKTSFLEKAGKWISKLTQRLPSNLKKVEVIKKNDSKP